MKFIVFSLDTKDKKPVIDEYKTMRTHMDTSGMPVTDAKGVFNGTEEKSFICVINNKLHEDMILAIAQAYKQECVLEVDIPGKKGYLRYFDGRPREYMGIWREADIDTKDNFTVSLDTMKVYKCYPETVDSTKTAVVG